MYRVIQFTYDGKERIALEGEPSPPRGIGCMQLKCDGEWKKGYRTFKPEKMIDCRELTGLKRAYYNLASVRMGVGQ